MVLYIKSASQDLQKIAKFEINKNTGADPGFPIAGHMNSAC